MDEPEVFFSKYYEIQSEFGAWNNSERKRKDTSYVTA